MWPLIHKHKAKIYDHCVYTLIIIKKFDLSNIKKFFLSGKYKNDKSTGKYENDKSIIWRIKINSTG